MYLNSASRQHLELAIGHSFNDARLLDTASMLPSRANELGVPSFKALANVGDKVLGQVLAADVVAADLGIAKGVLTEHLIGLVSNAALSVVGRAIGLNSHLQRGNCERYGSLSPRQLGDGVEALIGAVFFDAGYDAARALVRRLTGALG